MLFKLFPRSNVCKLMHFENAIDSIDSSECVTSVRFVHELNDDSPIDEHDSGMLIDFNFEQPLNANWSIDDNNDTDLNVTVSKSIQSLKE